MSSIFIKELKGEDWLEYKSIRLYALREHVGLYGSNYDKESQFPDSFWQEPLVSDDAAVFGLYDGQKIIGLTGVFTWREDPLGKTAIFVMDFIHKDYRAQGLAKLIYQSRIEWVKAHDRGFNRAIIAHRSGNEASRRAMMSFGFQFMDREMIDWPDGQKDWEYKYELQM